MASRIVDAHFESTSLDRRFGRKAAQSVGRSTGRLLVSRVTNASTSENVIGNAAPAAAAAAAVAVTRSHMNEQNYADYDDIDDRNGDDHDSVSAAADDGFV